MKTPNGRKFIIGLSSVLFGVLFLLVSPSSTAAELCLDPLCGYDDYGETSTKVSLTMSGLGTVEPVVAAAQIINVFLSILGFLTLVLTIYGGWIWIWARGNEEEITRGKDIIRGAIYGMVVILSSFGILQWLFYYFTKITNAVQ